MPAPALPLLQAFFDGLFARIAAAADAARDRANAVSPGSGDAPYSQLMAEVALIMSEVNVINVAALAMSEGADALRTGLSPVHHTPTDLAG